MNRLCLAATLLLLGSLGGTGCGLDLSDLTDSGDDAADEETDDAADDDGDDGDDDDGDDDDGDDDDDDDESDDDDDDDDDSMGGSTDDGSALACEAPPSCDACVECETNEGTCAAQAEDCLANASCAAIADCAYGCLELAADLIAYTTCIEACVAPHPAGEADFLVVLECLQPECLDACV